ncbi:sensor histidine kinase [Modestobacter sp. Leaf380]|uniref:sensor histidine kinase n=1 Tax=Modestobacter sp. Leaf380 TaxID=1736356 RepID=UPI0006F63C7D|nr:histidine kinase [Modestobacter sp. Leaf380]KQS71864.1 histidine kinase [Modestobacter sp. Leaf380]
MERQPVVERVSRRLRAHPFAVDAVVAGLLVLVCLALGTSTYPSQPGTAALVSLALLVPLAWRRTSTVRAAVAVLGAGLVEVVLVSDFLLANVAVPVMVHALAAYAPRPWRKAGLVLGLLGALLAAFRYFGGVYIGSSTDLIRGTVFSAVAIGVLVLATWALGDLKRSRLQREQALRERADLLELERDQEMRLAAGAERARIAREMHDVVAHSLSVVIAQADGGRYAGRTDPAAATGALEQIAATGRQALTDMRSLLGVLREDGVQEFAPQPDVAAIPGLVEDVRRSGLDVDLITEGQPVELAAGSQLAAYRIVQESLTNVLKHAGPASRAWVRLQWRAQALELSVLDDGRGASAATDGAGNGVLGMRERAQLHGGRLEAGPRHGGGFGVHAVLPYRQAR